MDYGSLIRDAWALTWRYRFLWILGLFSGAAVGSCSSLGNGSPLQYQTTPREITRTVPQAEAAFAAIEQWVSSHPALVALAAAAFLLIVLALVVISFIAQGGMTEATVDLAEHRPTSLALAWRAGQHLFWRFVGLTLLLIAAALTLAFLVGAVVAVAVGSSTLVAEGARGVVISLWVLIGVILALFSIPVAILATIVIAYAQRAIVVENVGPLAALRSGWLLLRAHFATSLLVWLVNVGLGIASAIAIGLATVLVIIVLVAVGLLFWAVLGLTTPVFVYAALGALVTIGAVWLMGAISNTFFWSYWTLAYLRLSEPPAPQAA